MISSLKIYSVSELTTEIKQTLEEDFSQISVTGEISNFKFHNSGHWYFNLKDSNAVICCTMWKGFNNYVFFTPQDGMKVIINGKLTVYPPRGNYQIDIRSMKPAGAGELQEAFEKLKQKLSAEGLFNEEYKKEIPSFPEKIGIITAKDGAAIQDMISIASRRYPLAELVIAHSKVQGIGAAENIARNITLFNKQKRVDVIIVARGGGSIEDLWAFNEEIVAKAIFNSEIPVVSGVGHEIDFTIADFVADLRAPTPSSAMEMITPDINDFFAFINEFSYNSTRILEELCENYKNKVISVLSSYGFRMPLDLIRRKSQQVDHSLYKLLQNIDKLVMFNKNKLDILSGKIEYHNIERILKKGFVLVKQDSKFIKRAENFDSELPALIKFYDDEINVKKIEN